MKRIVLAVGLVLLSVLTLVRGADPVPIQELREVYFDYLQRISPREYQPLPVRVVDIDEDSMASLGQWPWPRDTLAALVRRLNELGAAAIVFDVIFAEPDRMSPSAILSHLSDMDVTVPKVGLDSLAALDTDQMFAQAISEAPVVLGLAQAGGEPRDPAPAKAGLVSIGSEPLAGVAPLVSATNIVPRLQQATAGVGVISVAPTGDSNVIRKVPLLWRSGAGFYPALSMEALRVATGESTFVAQGAADIAGYMETFTVGGFVIPTLPDGQLWVRYRLDDPELYVSAKDVLDSELSPEIAGKLEGNIVFIGTSAAGLVDIRTTALRQSVAGVSIHAQIIEQILLGDYLIRNDVIDALEIFIFVALGLIVLSTMTWFGPMVSISAGTATGALVVLGSWIAFSRQGILFDATYPLVGGFLAFSGLAAYQFIVADRDKRLIRKSFSHYVAPGILDQIERTGHALELGGVNRPVTVMFCDIRNFTPLSESMSAMDLVTLLNKLFTELGSQILSEDGTIDKFIGDAIMAFWNAPVENEHHRRLAGNAALSMRKALSHFNMDREHVPISTAIGISSGIACVGNIGSRDRFNYSVIGDTVNVAARIEAACRHVEYDILLTEEAAEGLPGYALLEAGRLDLKGKSDRMHAYILVGDEAMAQSTDFIELRRLYCRFLEELTAKGEMDNALIEQCCELGSRIEPGLPAFFQRIPRRAVDLRGLTPADMALPNVKKPLELT